MVLVAVQPIGPHFAHRLQADEDIANEYLGTVGLVELLQAGKVSASMRLAVELVNDMEAAEPAPRPQCATTMKSQRQGHCRRDGQYTRYRTVLLQDLPWWQGLLVQKNRGHFGRAWTHTGRRYRPPQCRGLI